MGWTTLGWRWAFLSKNHFFWRSSFSPRWLCEQAELSYLGVRESAHHHGEVDASTTSDCLVWFLVRRHHWIIFLRKWARSCRHCQWRALPHHAKRILASQKFWRGGHRRHLVSTGRRTLPHSQRYNQSFAHCLRKSHNQPKCWCQLAASQLRFDSAGLFFMGNRQGWVLR